MAKGRDAPEHTLAQRGKVGQCPCCVISTHVAVPGPLRLEPYDHLKLTGIRLWAEGGPWAPRRLAAIYYVLRFNDRMPLPPRWDWAASSLEFTPPNALVRGVYFGAPIPIPTVAQVNFVPTLARESEPEEPKIAPKRPSAAREPEPEEQKIAPEQPTVPKQPAPAGPLRRYGSGSYSGGPPQIGTIHGNGRKPLSR